MKTERTQIHFLTDVLIAVASLDLKVTKAHETKHVMSFPLLLFSCLCLLNFVDPTISEPGTG